MSPADVPSGYRGREQAYVKHRVLERYLTRLFMILGQTRRSITYVDCFAGPWQDESDDLERTSIGIAIDLMEKCRAKLAQDGHRVEFRALFIEKDPASFERLQAFTESVKNVKAEALHGEFAELIPDICEFVGNRFAFFFIDPKGFRDVGKSTLDPLLQIPNSEFLITFMYDFLNRFRNLNSMERTMLDLLGEIPATIGMSPEESRRVIVRAYRDHLKATRPGRSWTAKASVNRPGENRVLYELVYCTSSSKGIEVFVTEADRVPSDNMAAAVEAKLATREIKTGMQDMFGGDEAEVPVAPEESGFSRAAEQWRSVLGEEPRKFGLNELADFVDLTDLTLSEIQGGFKLLLDRGEAQNLDARRKRPKNQVNFSKNERLVRLRL